MEHPRKKGSPGLETDSMQESHDELLKKEMNKQKVDLKTIQSLMAASFERRRKWIQTLKGKRTQEILKEYPGLGTYNQVCFQYFCFTLQSVSQNSKALHITT